MTIVAIRETMFVFDDTAFDYTGIVKSFIYIMLGVFILITLYIFWLAFIKKTR